MYTLSIIFDKENKNVLMRKSEDSTKYDFIRGNVHDLEGTLAASRRNLRLALGEIAEDINLKFVRQESVTTVQPRGFNTWSSFITCGILESDASIDTVRYEWIPIGRVLNMWLQIKEDGNNIPCVIEACNLLGIEVELNCLA